MKTKGPEEKVKDSASTLGWGLLASLNFSSFIELPQKFHDTN